MRIVPFADSATIQLRRCWTRRALLTDWLPGDLAEALWQQPERLLAEATVLQHRGVRRTVRITAAGRPFVLKHYVEPTWRHGLKQFVTRSRARATWNITHLLADSGVLTPRPVACIENTWGPLQLDSYLLYPYVEGETIGQHLATQHSPQPAVAELLRQLDALWSRLRSIEVSLADANPGNFIVSSDRQLWVIDLDKARQHRSTRLAESRRRRTWQQLMTTMPRVPQVGLSPSGNLGLRHAA